MYRGLEGLLLNMFPNFRDDGLDPIEYNILPNNTILFVTIDKFDPNPMLVNINKFKRYKSLKTKPCNFYWLNMMTRSLTNLFKPKNMYHYHLNLNILNL
jgi:hypothetical protein